MNGGRVASDFGALLRRHRLAAGLSQETLAGRAGLSPYGISALERGYRRTPRRETLDLLIKTLSLDTDQRLELISAATRTSIPRNRTHASRALGGSRNANLGKLPQSLARFVGRSSELEQIERIISANRFVTITGPGGIGKTRTAVRAAEAWRDAGGAAPCFIGFAPLEDPTLVVDAVASVIGVRAAANVPLLETLCAYLENKTILLVFDNCEHVIKQASATAEAVLSSCPHVRVLATSRESLHAAGERAYRLESLDANDAVALFADRAQATNARFELNLENRPLIEEICRQVAGIPLAIELAAARTGVLSLRAVAKELDQRIAILAGGERLAPPRHQTMRAAIDWSYELLRPPEKRLFERLSVFADDCAVEAATAVCAGDGVSTEDILSLISSLHDKSLLVAETAGQESRYRLLQPFREYAREKLAERCEGKHIARRHVLAYIELASRFAGRDQHYAAYYGYPRDEIGNWRAAVRWALTERNDVLSGMRLVSEVVSSWGGTTPLLNEARRWVPAALELVDEHTLPEVRAKLKLAEAKLAMDLDNHALQLASANVAVRYYREAGDARDLVRSQTIAGNALFDLGRTDEAKAILEEALSIARAMQSRWHIANALRNLSCANLNAGDTAEAQIHLREASQILRDLGDGVDIDLTVIDFARLAFEKGDPASAVVVLADLFVRGLDPFTPRRILVLGKLNMSEYLITLERYSEAREQARDALTLACEEHLDVYKAQALLRLAVIAAKRPKTMHPQSQAVAARLLGFVDARIKALGSTFDIASDAAIAALHRSVGVNTVADLSAEGAAMNERRALEEAMAI